MKNTYIQYNSLYGVFSNSNFVTFYMYALIPAACFGGGLFY